MPLRGLLLLLIASSPARAQELPVPLPDVAPAAPEVLPEPLGTRFVWELLKPLGAGARPADIAIQPATAGTWLVVDEGGAVWRSEDAGRAWQRVLTAGGSTTSGKDGLFELSRSCRKC